MTAPVDVHELAALIAAALAERQAAPALLDADQAGAMLNVPPSWCLAEARAGRLPCVRLGRYVRFRHGDVEQWLDRRAK